MSTLKTINIEHLDATSPSIVVNAAGGIQVGGALTATTGTFSGNVSVAGVLSYEDVANIDSVGIITAQSGINVTGGTVVVDSGKIQSGGDPNDGTAVGSKMLQTGVIQAARASGSGTSAVYMGFLQGTATATSRINANGSSVFARELQVGDGGGSSNTGIRLNENGYAYFSRNDVATPFIRGYRTDTSENTFTVLASGAATFSDSITAKSSSFKNVTDSVYTYISNKPGADALCLSGGSSGDPNTTWWQIKPNGDFHSLGSATFASEFGSVSGNNRSYLAPGNVIIQNTTKDTTSAFYIQGGRGSASQENVVTITTNGQATFAGSIIHGSLSPGGGGGNYMSVGEVAAYSPAAGNHVWRGWNATSSPNVLTSQIYSNGNAVFAGSLSKGSGSFKIDHPLPAKTETHHLVHSFIEGPQADLIYRGYVDLVDGQATVNIDTAGRMTEGTFEVLCTNVSCFTSNESDWTAVKGSVTGNVLTITAQDNTSTSKVSWMVVGERKDQHMIDTDWTDSNGRVITEPLKS